MKAKKGLSKWWKEKLSDPKPDRERDKRVWRNSDNSLYKGEGLSFRERQANLAWDSWKAGRKKKNPT